MAKDLRVRFSISEEPMSSKVEVIDREGRVLGLLPCTAIELELHADDLPRMSIELLAGQYEGSVIINPEQIEAIVSGIHKIEGRHACRAGSEIDRLAAFILQQFEGRAPMPGESAVDAAIRLLEPAAGIPAGGSVSVCFHPKVQRHDRVGAKSIMLCPDCGASWELAGW